MHGLFVEEKKHDCLSRNSNKVILINNLSNNLLKIQDHKIKINDKYDFRRKYLNFKRCTLFDVSHLHFLTILLIDIYFFIQIIYRISSTMVTLHPLDNNMKNKKYYTIGTRTLL